MNMDKQKKENLFQIKHVLHIKQVAALRDVLTTKAWDRPEHHRRAAVT